MFLKRTRFKELLAARRSWRQRETRNLLVGFEVWLADHASKVKLVCFGMGNFEDNNNYNSWNKLHSSRLNGLLDKHCVLGRNSHYNLRNEIAEFVLE